MINFLQVNLGHGKQAQDLLLHKLLESKIHVAIISEHYKKSDSQIWYEDKTKRAAILIMDRNMNIGEIDEQNEYFVFATINNVRVYSCYFPPSLDMGSFTDQLRKLDHSIRMAKSKVLIGGDFNSKSPEWNANILDKRGENVTEMIASLGLIIYNNGNSATFRGAKGNSSIIDITFGSYELYGQEIEWKVLEEITLSDHQYITYKMNTVTNRCSVKPNLPRWNVKKLDVDKFKNIMQEAKLRSHIDNTSAESLVNKTIKIFVKCCNYSMPKLKEYNLKRKPAFWWTQEIGQTRRECLHARRLATRNHDDVTLANAYKTLRKTLRHMINKSKKEEWKKFCSTLDADPWGKPYRIISKKMCSNKPIPGIRDPQWAETIVSTLFPFDQRSLIKNRKFQTINEFVPFNKEELNRACCKQKLGKSPGPDGIPNEVIRLTEQVWPELLLHVYNKCFENGVFPICWKKQFLVLLRKGNKPLTEPNSYRPLCMINTLGKLYESLLLYRLEKNILELGGLSSKQYGFQKGKSTVDAIRNVTDIALVSKNSKGFCIIVTLDVKNAFNTVRWNVVLDSLKSKGIETYLYNTIVDYLSDRILMYDTESGTKEYQITAGVPQGSVLGPFLWNIMYDGLLRMRLPTEAHIIGYADDIALVITHTIPEAIEIVTNDCISRCDRWLTEHGLKLAAEKTEAILITNRRIFRMPEISVNGEKITFRRSLKYLGLQLDSRLNFKEHVTNI